MILDTAAYSALQNGRPEILQVLKDVSSVYMPLPVVAELKAGFLKGKRTDQNMRILEHFLSAPNIEILYPTMVTADHYAELQAYCWKHGWALSHNDLWIGAFVVETGDQLITYDHDFDVFQTMFADKLNILPTV